MSEVTLHPVPTLRDVVREQIRIIGISLRREALALAIVLGVVSVAVLIDIVHGTAESWFDSDDWSQISFLSFLVPFAVWRRDRRFGPAFLWTLPVDRSRLALAKVFAGWFWLMITLAAFVAWQFLLATIAGVEGAQIVPLVAFAGVTAMYLLGSALVIGIRHPLRWLIGSAGVMFLIGMIQEAIARGPNALDRIVRSSGFAALIENTFLTTTLWLAAGVIALWAAISRHRENR